MQGIAESVANLSNRNSPAPANNDETYDTDYDQYFDQNNNDDEYGDDDYVPEDIMDMI